MNIIRAFSPRSIRSLFYILTSLFALLVCLGFTPTDGKRLEVLNRLDNLYYYPQRSGLQKFSARLIWEQADISSGSERYRQNPEAIFHWVAKTRQRTFELSGHAKTLPSQEQNQLLEFFNRYKEIVIPMTLEEKFSKMNSRVSKPENGVALFEFRPLGPSDPNKQYDVIVDLKEWAVRQLRFHRKSEPEKVLSSLEYIQKEGLWLVSHSRALYDIGSNSFEESTRYFYNRIKDFWLVQKIQQTIKQDGKTQNTLTLRLDQFKIN